MAACGVAVTLLSARVLGYPSESESLQDLLTAHFSRRDRAHPWPEFLDLEVNFWVEWLRRALWQPFLLAALVAAAWGALRQRPAFGVFLVAAALTGVLNQAGHPDINIYGDRLIVLVWVLPVLGLPLLLESVVRPWAGAWIRCRGPFGRRPGWTPGSLDERTGGPADRRTCPAGSAGRGAMGVASARSAAAASAVSSHTPRPRVPDGARGCGVCGYNDPDYRTTR